MAEQSEPTSNARPASTTWEWRKVRVRARTPAPGARRPKGVRTRFSRRNWRDPLTCTLTFRGGPEQWVQVRARGETINVPGHIAVVDVLARLSGMSQEGYDGTENGR